jgi:hypothetical protein
MTLVQSNTPWQKVDMLNCFNQRFNTCLTCLELYLVRLMVCSITFFT